MGRLPPIGFWSYARGDDDASRGRLSALRTLLRTELQAQYCRDPVQIFQDVAAIPPGSEWETEIRRALGQATFFIPIITPQFIQSEWCCKEVTIFLDRERSIWREHPELAGVRRIFPIHYRDIHEIDPFDPTIVTEIRRLQWVDFRGLRRKAEDDEALTGSIDRLAESVCRLLRAPPECGRRTARRADGARRTQAPDRQPGLARRLPLLCQPRQSGGGCDLRATGTRRRQVLDSAPRYPAATRVEPIHYFGALRRQGVRAGLF